MERVGISMVVGCAAATGAFAAALVARRALVWAHWRRAVALLTEFKDSSATPPPRLCQVFDAMVVEMHVGLAPDGGNMLKMRLTSI